MFSEPERKRSLQFLEFSFWEVRNTKTRLSTLRNKFRASKSFYINRSLQKREVLAVSDGELNNADLDGRGSDQSLNSLPSGQTAGLGSDRSVASWAVSFERLLQDPLGVEYFTEFLKKEYSAENIHFWKSCEKYQSIPTDDTEQLLQESRQIYNEYLSSTSLCPVNVDQQALITEEMLEKPTPDLFKVQQLQIFNLMKFDSYARFVKSPLYQECMLSEVEGRPLPNINLSPTNPNSGCSAMSSGAVKKKKLRPGKSLPIGVETSGLDNLTDGPRVNNRSFKRKDRRGNVRDSSELLSRRESEESLNSATSLDLSIISSFSGKSEHDSGSQGSTEREADSKPIKYCCVYLPDGTASLTAIKPGLTIREMLTGVCEKRGYNSSDVKVYLAGNEQKALALDQECVVLTDQEVKLQNRISFDLQIEPMNKSLRIVSKPSKTIHEALQSALKKYGLCNQHVVLHREKTMPTCLITNCASKTGRKGQDAQIILHPFPKTIEKIKLWLQQTGQEFEDINLLSQKILEENKFNKYRLCSLHFTSECYLPNKKTRTLRPEAVPSVFPELPEGKNLIEESLKKERIYKKRSYVGSVSGVIETNSDSIRYPKNVCCVSTQTDFTMLNSEIRLISETSHLQQLSSQAECLSQSVETSLSSPNKYSPPKTVNEKEYRSPMKKRPHLLIPCSVEQDSNFLEDTGISAISQVIQSDYPEESVDSQDLYEFVDNTDKDYIPSEISLDDSEYCGLGSILLSQEKHMATEMNPLTTSEQVKDRKFLIFESCLDKLYLKVKCQYSPDCNFLVKSFKKKFDGSSFQVTGKCYDGHQFTIFESQPKVGNYHSGNLLIAASILFSGLNFQKVKELFNILGMVSISEKTFYRYQFKFLFPVIDRAWLEEKQSILEELKHKPLCIAGDGQCDSPGHSAKYCIFTVMDCLSEKIIDLEVVQKTQCSSSVAMEKFAFGIVMQRLLDDGLNISIFASDRHVGIRKTMRLEYPQINHQFDVWHYAKSLKKKLVQASHQRFCREIIPWVDKIGLHFWWSIQTCDDNLESLKERWLSLLQHISNCHEWDGNIYNRCSHGPINLDEKNVLWLNPETAPYLAIKKIVTNAQLIADLPHLVHNCHTGSLENFHSLVLKYRTKRIHFSMDGMEARTKLAALTHNRNVGRELATVKYPKKNTEAKGTQRTKLVIPKGKSRWIIKNVYESMNVQYLEDLAVSVLQIANGELEYNWNPRASSLPPNLANLERPNKDDIKKYHIARFRSKGVPSFSVK